MVSVCSSLLIFVITCLTQVISQLQTDEAPSAILIQPPLIPTLDSQSFNGTEKLFGNVGLYLFKRKIQIEEFYYTKDNTTTPIGTVVNVQDMPVILEQPANGGMPQISELTTSTRPPPPTTDRVRAANLEDFMSMIEKRQTMANTTTTSRKNLVPPPTTSTTSSSSTFKPFSFSLPASTAKPPMSPAVFRLPSLLERFKRPTMTASTETSTASTPPSTTSTPATIQAAIATPPPPIIMVPRPRPAQVPKMTGPAPFRLPSILDRFKKQVTTSVTESTTQLPSSPMVSFRANTPQPSLQANPQPVFVIASNLASNVPIVPQQPPIADISINSVLVTQSPLMGAIATQSSVNTTPLVNSPLISVTALDRRRFSFRELSSGPLLNETSPTCRKQLRQTDSCLKNILLISADVPVPRNEGQLNETYCGNLTETLKCLGGYSKCLTRIPRIIYNFVYLSVKRQLTDICKNEVSRNLVIKHANCFQTDADRKVLRDVSNRGTLTAAYVLQHIPANQVIQWGCCGFFKMYEDGKKAIDNLCSKRTGSQTGKWIMDLVMKSAADLLEIGCLRFNSIKSCSVNLPASIETFNALTSGDLPDQKFSPVIPLIEIARKLAGDL